MEFCGSAGHDPTATLDRAVGAMTAASAEVLEGVAVHDERCLWEPDGARSMTGWLAARYGLARGTAREWVRVAHALRRLPRIAEAYARGRLSWDQLRPVTRFADAETDEYWAARAPRLRPQTLVREAMRRERVDLRGAEAAHRARSFWMQWDLETSVLYLGGQLPAEQGAALERALERRVERVASTDGLAGVSRDARMADALVELVSRGGHGDAPDATIVVHADAATLAGREPVCGPWLGETEAGQRLAAETIRRLACDARIERVVTSRGRPVGIGRRSRSVPGHLMRLLRHRDLGCRFPGCERTGWLKAHHLLHWADGGAANLDNLVLVCHAHHRLIHEGGWTSGHPAGELRFHDPTGRPMRQVRPRPPGELRAQQFP